jgi:hypothetical protein
MDEEFDATEFVDQFHQGLFDGRVNEELAKLTLRVEVPLRPVIIGALLQPHIRG